MDTLGSKIAPRLEKSISSLVSVAYPLWSVFNPTPSIHIVDKSLKDEYRDITRN
jgi:hypothetical protein